MRLQTFLPHVSLRPFVRFYWVLRPDQSDAIHRLLPGTGCDIIVQMGTPALFSEGGDVWKKREPEGFVEGSFEGPFFLKFQADPVLVGIRFTSTGLYSFVKTPVTEFRQQFIPLDDVFGKSGAELILSLPRSLDRPQLSAILDRFLLSRIDRREELPALRQTINTIIETRGAVPIGEIRKTAGWSERCLERSFSRHVGMTPQRFARIVRLNHFIHLVRTTDPQPFTRLAYECGFADQSHLIRSFRKHTGLAPGEYFRETHPIHFALNEGPSGSLWSGAD